MGVTEEILKEKYDKLEKILWDTIGHYSPKEIKRRGRNVTCLTLNESRYYFDDICFVTIKEIFEPFSHRWDFSYLTRGELEHELLRARNARLCFGI